jgi:FkbH-like protein
MRGVFAPIDDAELHRAAQLIQRSNQFNLRTQRLSAEQIRSLASGTESFACFCTLEDKFGDHGIISILCGEVRPGNTLFISEWVMSCRVLGRGVEEFILNQLVAIARSKSCTQLLGEYLPTEKNAMVANLYERLGFLRIAQDTVQFKLHVDSGGPLATFIQIKPNPTTLV